MTQEYVALSLYRRLPGLSPSWGLIRVDGQKNRPVSFSEALLEIRIGPGHGSG